MTKVFLRLLLMLSLYIGLRYYGGDLGRQIFYPVQLLVTFLHEMGHALGAIISGGSVLKFQINANGGGYTATSGGSRALILMGGYLGSAIFGNIIFLIGARSRYLVKPLLYLMSASMIFAGTLWFNSFFTTGFLFCFAIFLILIAWKSNWGDEILMFLGLACILYIIQDFDVGPKSDLEKYAEIMKIFPVQFWMYFWLFIALALFAFNIKVLFKSGSKEQNELDDDFMTIKSN